MAFVTTCPAHRLFLMDVGRGSLKTAQFLIKATEADKTPPPDDLTLWLDTKTLEALQTGYVRIGEAPPMNAATYFRMVRTMIEEMNSRKFTNPAQSEAMKNLWRSILSQPTYRLSHRCGVQNRSSIKDLAMKSSSDVAELLFWLMQPSSENDRMCSHLSLSLSETVVFEKTSPFVTIVIFRRELHYIPQ